MAEETKTIPKWLKRTQENSWEAEILLSGLVLFALIQIPGFIEKLEQLLNIKLADPTMYLIALDFFTMAVEVLISGFIIHLILRGIWVGFVGLTFVFPKGSDAESLKMTRKFKSHLHKLPSPVNAILKIEKNCSLVFSISFLIFGYVISLMMFTIVLFVMAELTEKFSFVQYVIIVYFLLGFIYFIDFITSGALKRIRWIAPVYYPIYRFFGFITLSFIYKNIYYTILSNIKRWKIYLSAVLYIIGFLLVSSLSEIKNNELKTDSNILSQLMSEKRKIPNSYENLRGEGSVSRASIQSDVIEDDYLSLFLVHHASFDKRLPKAIKLNDENELTFAQINRALNRLYTLKVDTCAYNQVTWSFYVHPETDEPGISTILDIKNIEPGWHNLHVEILNKQDNNEQNIVLVGPSANKLEELDYDKQSETDSTETYIIIPFFKSR